MTSISKGSNFLDTKFSGIDTNASTITASIDVSSVRELVWTVAANSGSHDVHNIILQCSLDDSTWQDTSNAITGLGILEHPINAQYVRFKTTVVEGHDSTVDIHIQGK